MSASFEDDMIMELETWESVIEPVRYGGHCTVSWTLPVDGNKENDNIERPPDP